MNEDFVLPLNDKETNDKEKVKIFLKARKPYHK